MRRRTFAAVVAAATLVVAAAAFVAVYLGNPGRAAAIPTRAHPAVRLDTAGAAAAGTYFLTHYEQPSGRVVRWDQGGDTVSEGQAYAMLVADALGQRSRFAAAWSWSKSHLLESDGLLAWRYRGGKVVGGQAAADADLDSAWALELASRRFSEPSYAAAARRLSRSILAHEVQDVDGQDVLLAGPWAAAPAPIINPSYLATGDMDALGPIDPRWRSVAATSSRLLGELIGRGTLPSDWAIVVPGGVAHPIAPPGQSAAPVTYGFDAVRLPVWMASSCRSGQVSLAASLWPDLSRALQYNHGALVGLDLGASPQSAASDAPIGLVGAAGAAAAAGHPAEASRLLEAAQRQNEAHPTYYTSAWVALGRILLQTRDLGNCPP